MNGTHGAIDPAACSLTDSQDCAETSAPGGSAARTRATSAATALPEPALAQRSSTWAVGGVCSAAI